MPTNCRYCTGNGETADGKVCPKIHENAHEFDRLPPLPSSGMGKVKKATQQNAQRTHVFVVSVDEQRPGQSVWITRTFSGEDRNHVQQRAISSAMEQTRNGRRDRTRCTVKEAVPNPPFQTPCKLPDGVTMQDSALMLLATYINEDGRAVCYLPNMPFVHPVPKDHK